jgi:hypothetical protein
MNGATLVKIVIPHYINKVAISKQRRAQYFKAGDSIPQKYGDKRYKIIPPGTGVLTDTDTMEKVIKNSLSVGKPRYWIIAGNDVLSGIDYNLRSKVFKELKRYFYEFFREIKPIDKRFYPITIGIDFFDILGDYDLDNLIIVYRKCITDALCGNVEFVKTDTGKKNKNDATVYNYVPDYEKYPKKLLDDNVRYVQGVPTMFYPVNREEDRQMVITINSLNI